MASKVATHGFADFLHEQNLAHLLPFLKFQRHRKKSGDMPDAQSLARLLAELGPGFAEMARIMASRSDVMPAQYQKELLRLKREPKLLTNNMVSALLRQEFGNKISGIISSINWEPYSINLLGATYEAILHDGQRALITINYPGEMEIFKGNMEVIAWLLDWFVEKEKIKDRALWEGMNQELSDRAYFLRDLTKVAGRMEVMRAKFEGNSKIIIPEVFWKHTTPNMLVHRYRNLPTLTDIKEGRIKGIAGKYVARYVIDAMVYQYGAIGAFILRPEARRFQVGSKNSIAYNSFLATGYLEPEDRKKFIALLYALCGEKRELGAKVLLSAHYAKAGAEAPKAGGLVLGAHKTASLSAGLWDILERSWKGGINISLGINMASESILYLEHMIREFDGEVDVADSIKGAIKKYAPEIFGVKKNAAIETVVKSVL